MDKVDYANQNNIDFIICDHHRPGKKLPDAVAVLDPKREDCNYPYSELSGCGVGFKLIQAYCFNQNIEFNQIAHLMDLLAVSIAADIVPITGENRVMAFYGLKQINSSPRTGLKALMSSSQRRKEDTISKVGWSKSSFKFYYQAVNQVVWKAIGDWIDLQVDVRCPCNVERVHKNTD